MPERIETQHRNAQRGQALVEYTLIVALFVIGFAAAIAATGPIIGNVFSNTVYNLVGADPEEAALRATLPLPEDFWLTVTWVAQQTPVETPLPTRTQPPSTRTATPGPPPTATPVTPTRTPIPTDTPEPTPIPFDIRHEYPFTDSAEPGFGSPTINWRLDDDYYMGANDWYGLYFNEPELTSNPIQQGYNNDLLGEELYGRLDFNWGNGAATIDQPDNFWGASWRQIVVLNEDDTTLQFNVNSSDEGFRVWIVGGIYGGSPNLVAGGPGSCSNEVVPWDTVRDVTSGGPYVPDNPSYRRVLDDFTAHGAYDPSDPDSFSTECLLADYWMSGTRYTNVQIERTVPLAGIYMVQVDYFDNDGPADFSMEIRNPDFRINPDDTTIDASGNPQPDQAPAGVPRCGWSQYNDPIEQRANSLDYLWDENVPGQSFPAGARCYLELRGYVGVPTSAVEPALSLWDVWDLGSNSFAWVEVAEWQGGGSESELVVNHDLLDWTRIPLHSGSSFNYNWTQHTIPLADIISGYSVVTSGTGQDERRVTFRFGLESRQATGDKWYIDTIRMGDTVRQTFFTDQDWNFDDPVQADDFITSGHWGILNDSTRGSSVLHDSVEGDTARFPERNTAAADDATNNPNVNNLRRHVAELNGWVDLGASPAADSEGDQGTQLLSFFHRYDLPRRTRLEVQYTTDDYSCIPAGYTSETPITCGGGAGWQTIPGGTLVSYDLNLPSNNGAYEYVEIQLEPLRQQIEADEGSLIPFRLRFVLSIQMNAADVSGDTGDGWWLDDVRLERQGRAGYLEYPYYNPADLDTDIQDWVSSSTWGFTPFGQGRRNPQTGSQERAFTDTPFTPYPANQTTTLELRYALDMFMDSEDNPASPDCTAVDSQGNDICLPLAERDEKPIDPVFIFYHHRQLDTTGEGYALQWRRKFVDGDDWETIWAYHDNLDTDGPDGSVNRTTRLQRAWERAEVDLRPVVERLNALDDGASDVDDDISFRFVFTSNGDGGLPTNVESGIYLDDIAIRERQERYWRLWQNGATATDYLGNVITNPDTGSNILGQGNFFDGIDNNQFRYDQDRPAYFYGGQWNAYSATQRSGLFSLHDSGVNQFQAPPDVGVGNDDFASQGRSFSVLQLGPIFDLRGVSAGERPILEFWARYAINNGSSIRVEASFYDENLTGDFSTTPPTGNRGTDGACLQTTDILGNTTNLLQCYERDYGWSEWIDITQTTEFDRSGQNRTYTWEMFRAPLDSFAKGAGRPGRLVRIRWVMDTYGTDTSSAWDGLWIDDINLKLHDPRVVSISPSDPVFADTGRNMNNWIGEGTWGLSPEFFRGSGGGPSSLGNRTWSYEIWGRASINLADYQGNGDAEAFTNANYATPNPGGFQTLSDAFGYLAYFDYFLTQPAGGSIPTAADVAADVTGTAFEINNDWGTSGPAPGITDRFVGRWVLDTGKVVTDLVSDPTGDLQSGTYTFIVASDDGVRMKYNSIDTGGVVTGDVNAANDWNIVNNWTYHGRTVDMGTAELRAESEGAHSGARYRFTVEYFDRDDDAVLELSTGNDTFSFTDSPKSTAGVIIPDDAPALERSHSSLMFDGVFDMSNAISPLLQYYTYWETRDGTTLDVELSLDGGFTWEEAALSTLGGRPITMDTFNSYWDTNWIASYFEGRYLDYQLDAGANSLGWRTSTVPYLINDFGTEIEVRSNDAWPANSPVNDSSQWSQDIVAGDPDAIGRQPVGDGDERYFSVRLYRRIVLPEPMRIRMTAQSDDGNRVWVFSEADGTLPNVATITDQQGNDSPVPLPLLNSAGGLSCAQNDSNGDPFESGKPAPNDDAPTEVYTRSDPNNGCLAIGMWSNKGLTQATGVAYREIPAGVSWIVMDYYESTGGNQLDLDFSDPVVAGFDTPKFGGGVSGLDNTNMPSSPSTINQEWQLRQHDLRDYAGFSNVALRFELDREGQNGPSEGGYGCPAGIGGGANQYASQSLCDYQHTKQTPSDWLESWWLVDIQLYDQLTGEDTPIVRLNRGWTDTWKVDSWDDTNLDFDGASDLPYRTGDDWGTQINTTLGWPAWSHPVTDDLENFSMRITRTLRVEGEPLTLEFDISSDDGVRVWVNYTPTCSDRVSGQANGGRTGATIGSGLSNGCLVIDDWQTQGMDSTPTGRVTLPPLDPSDPDYVIQIDYFAGGQPNGLIVDVTAVD